MKVTTTQLILGLAVAAATGAAIGMLMAPEKGTDLQNKIKEGSRAWLDEVGRLLGTGKDFAEKTVSDAEAQLGEIKSNLSRIED